MSVHDVRRQNSRGRTRSSRSTRAAFGVLPLLHLARTRTVGSPEAMREIAALLGITPAEVLGTCTFYTMYKRARAASSWSRSART